MENWISYAALGISFLVGATAILSRPSPIVSGGRVQELRDEIASLHVELDEARRAAEEGRRSTLELRTRIQSLMQEGEFWRTEYMAIKKKDN